MRKERKITIQTANSAGTENTTSRTLTNPSPTEALRIDYYSMMRKWRVRLLQYGARMTYDITVPRPGEALRRIYQRMAWLEDQIGQTFSFGLQAAEITRDSVDGLALSHGVTVENPPEPYIHNRLGGPVLGLETWDQQPTWRFYEVPFAVPDGYRVSYIAVEAQVAPGNDPPNWDFSIYGVPSLPPEGSPLIPPGAKATGLYRDLSTYQGFMINRTGSQKITYFQRGVIAGAVTFPIVFEPTWERMRTWQNAVWQALRDAAADRFHVQRQQHLDELEGLRAQLEGVDTLTLRREERDEIMKCVLRWLLGPQFEFMPQDVAALLDPATNPALSDGRDNDLGVNATGWSTVFAYQETVKFIQQTIEWENLLYFTYPYFWDVPAQWDFIRSIRHTDPTREQFLRAGSARVVITLRPGFEDAFAAFVETGRLGSKLPPEHPYMTIGAEIRAYNQANYPGIPPANPEKSYRPLLSPRQRRAWEDMQQIIAALAAYRDAHGTYPATNPGLTALGSGLPSTDPWGNAYVYASPGVLEDYDLSSLGADGVSDAEAESAAPSPTAPPADAIGLENKDITSWANASLIGEWFEYTPSRGIDIQLNTSLPEMA